MSRRSTIYRSARDDAAGPDHHLPLVNPELSILPPRYYTENPPEKVAFALSAPAGTSSCPTRPARASSLKAFDKYRLGKPPVDDVVVKSVPEVATRISELKAGSADLMVGVPADLKESLERTPGVKVVVAPSYRRLFIAIKQGRHPALADVRVRQAMNYAINCDEIAGALIGGMANCQIDLINSPYNNPDLKPFPMTLRKPKQAARRGGLGRAERMASAPRTACGLPRFRHHKRLVPDGQGDRPGHGGFWKDVGIEIKDLRVIDNAINAQMRAKQGAGYRDL